MKGKVNEGFRIENTITYIADLFLFSSGLLALIYEGKYFNYRIKKIYLILLGLIVFVYLKSGASLFDIGTFLSVKGIGPWLGLSVLFTAGNDKRFTSISKTILLLGVILTIGGIIKIGRLGLSFDREYAISTLMLVSVNLMWISFVSICLFFNKYKKIVVSLFLVSFLLSFVISSRSFLLLHFFMLIYLAFKLIQSKIYIYISILTITLIGVFSFNFISNNSIVKNSIGFLDDRITKDTRTDQYAEFLNNTNTSDFIFGAGTFSKWKQGGTMYAWLDNQVLLTAWWAGILPVVLYLTLLFIPIKRFFFKKNTENEIHSLSFIIFLWVLALSGLSIFTAISTSLYFFIISFILGRLLTRKKITRIYVEKQ